MKIILAVTLVVALGLSGCTQGTTYTFTIVSGPTGSALTVDDYTSSISGAVTNYVCFSNHTDSTVILIGGSNWSSFLSPDSLTIASADSTTLPLTINTGMTNEVTVGYSLRYQGQYRGFRPDEVNPVFIVKP